MKNFIILSLVIFSFSSCGVKKINKTLEQQLWDFCHTYLVNLPKKYGKTVTENTIQMKSLKRDNSIVGNIFNIADKFFTPKDQQIHTVYKCKFEMNFNETSHAGNMDLILYTDLEQASYHVWKNIQTKKGTLFNPDQTAAFYIVVKYLEINQEYMHINNNLFEFFQSL